MPKGGPGIKRKQYANHNRRHEAADSEEFRREYEREKYMRIFGDPDRYGLENDGKIGKKGNG
jgi:hypothetical protein